MPVVAPAAHFEVGGQQREEPKPGEQLRVRFQASVNQDAGQVRIGDDFLDDSVAALAIGGRDPQAERIALHVFAGTLEVAFVVEERRAVGDQVLQVAGLRPVDGRVIHLREDAATDGEPDAARRRVGGAHSVLPGGGPTRPLAGATRGGARFG